MKTVLTFSIFKNDLFGHGGEKRTAQIHEILSSRYDVKEILCKFRFNAGKLSLKSKVRGVKGIPDVLRFSRIYKNNFSIDKILIESNKAWMQAKNLRSYYDIIGEAAAIIWENNLPDFFYLPYLIKKEFPFKRIIACPHNLESLVPNQSLRFYGNNKLKYLEQELEPLRCCDKVVVISEEEQWLLNLFGINAEFLPYYPQAELFESLMSIRNYRQDNGRHETGTYFLSLGSITNAPTKKGMQNLLEQLEMLDIKYRQTVNFKIAGTKTETLRERFQNQGVDIVGSVSSDRLEALLKDCKGVVINQGYSTGALTKIPDLLVAGIPIIIDEGASRTYRRYDGIYGYNSFEDLRELLSMPFQVPAIPAEPIKRYEAFLKLV